MIKAMHVVLGLDIGGLEAFVADLCEEYAQDVESLIVCLRGDGDAIPPIAGARVVFLNGSEGFSLSLAYRLARLIRRENIDIVHTHNPGPHLYGALAGWFSLKPVIHTKHGRNYPSRRKKVWLNRVATAFTDRIVAVSKDSELVCREIEGIPARKLCTILNGIDISRFSPKARNPDFRRELGIDAGVPVVGIVARLSRVKNHRLMFRSVAELKRRGVAIALCVVGDGPLREALHQSVADLELGDEIHFLGGRTDVPTLYPEFDVFALSSSSEGVSLTLLEAMSCQLPVVATNVGGNPEVVVDGVTGFLVEQSEAAIADALEALLTGEDAAQLRSRMGIAGSQRVQSKFCMRTTAAAYLAQYRKLLAHDPVKA